MKKNVFLAVFLYVLLFLVIAPIIFQFFGDRQEAVVAYYPFVVFLNGGIAFLIYYFALLKGRLFEKPVIREKKPFFVYSSSALVSFGILCLSSVIFESASYFFEIGGGIQKVIFPSSFLGWINFFFGVIFAAFFEEVIYRFYLPRAFREIFGKLRIFGKFDAENNLRLSVLCEGLALLLFGLGHLYLGVLGFLNAILCGSALRFCMIKTKSLWIPFGIHAVYNFLSFLIVFLLF